MNGTIMRDTYNTAALVTLNADKTAEESITVRQSNYLNNLVEQDHRNIKRRIRQIWESNHFAEHRPWSPALSCST